MSTVLIVDDEPAVRENLNDLLENLEYKVVQASNGIEALKRLSNEIPDLIISDIMMPVMNGYELLDKVQSDPLYKSIPIILLTAKSDTQSFRKAMQSGADDYLTKPYDAADLVKAVKKRLEKKQNEKARAEEIIKNILLYVPNELRTPLMSILDFSELITKSFYSLSGDEIWDLAERIKVNGRNLQRTVEKFITFSSLVCSPLFTNDQDYSMNNCMNNPGSIINSAALAVAGNYKRAGDLHFDIADRSVMISQKNMELIITELVENAMKFSFSGTPVEIKGESIKDEYIISIKDYGKGMTVDQISALMTFLHFGRTSNEQFGNGLGLIISKKAAGITGGRLEVESIASSYTVIRIYLELN